MLSYRNYMVWILAFFDLIFMLGVSVTEVLIKILDRNHMYAFFALIWRDKSGRKGKIRTKVCFVEKFRI